MTITITDEGQITIPPSLRDRAGWQPGCNLVLDADANGELFLRPERIPKTAAPDRFDRALGAAEIKWDGTTDEYMALIRGED